MIKKWRVPEAVIGFFVTHLAKDGDPAGVNIASVFISTASVNALKTAFSAPVPMKNSQRK
jgi:hypothetical protein